MVTHAISLVPLLLRIETRSSPLRMASQYEIKAAAGKVKVFTPQEVSDKDEPVLWRPDVGNSLQVGR